MPSIPASLKYIRNHPNVVFPTQEGSIIIDTPIDDTIVLFGPTRDIEKKPTWHHDAVNFFDTLPGMHPHIYIPYPLNDDINKLTIKELEHIEEQIRGMLAFASVVIYWQPEDKPIDMHWYIRCLVGAKEEMDVRHSSRYIFGSPNKEILGGVQKFPWTTYMTSLEDVCTFAAKTIYNLKKRQGSTV